MKCYQLSVDTYRFADALSTALAAPTTEDLLHPSAAVGSLSFARPTVYIYPAGEGSCSVFCISGFSMLVDGGYSRRMCAWDFIKHLSRLDAVLSTGLSAENSLGLAALIERKALRVSGKGAGDDGAIYPEVGAVVMNVGDAVGEKEPNKGNNPNL